MKSEMFETTTQTSSLSRTEHFNFHPVRWFLWSLVVALCIHGFLRADEYGTAASFLGGVSLTMSIWKESISEGTRSLFWGAPTYVGVPRAIVVAALRETARHPGIHTLPQLQRALQEEQNHREYFRTLEMDWWIRFNGVIGGLLSDPDGRQIWTKWDVRYLDASQELAWLQSKGCSFYRRARSQCNKTEYDEQIKALTVQFENAAEAQKIWRKILYEQSLISPRVFVETTMDNLPPMETLIGFEDRLRHLYNVTDPGESRIRELQQWIPATQFSTAHWEQITVENLLMGTLWDVCMNHIQKREGRIQDRMIAAGYQELYINHERIYNASLRLLGGLSTPDMKRVQEWFIEMMGYSWWLSDDIPALVRRCVSQEHGDCVRIGPTEISTMANRFQEQGRIVGDWFRRIFIGLWNGMPVVGLLFVMELIVMCVPQKVRYYSHSPQPMLMDRSQPHPQTLMLRTSPHMLTDGDA